MDWAAVRVTAELAACTTFILFLLGLPLAYWAATTRRWWRVLVEASIALPILLPPTVIGFYLLVATGPHSPIGRMFEKLTGDLLPFSFGGILLGSVVYNLPFAVRPFTSALAGVDRRLIEASWCLGVSRAGTFRRVMLPLAWPGILTGLVLAFAHTVGEFGVVLMLGGDRPGVTRTLSVSIYDSVQSLDYTTAGRTSLALVLFAFVVLSITYGLQRRVPGV
ncbi:MAG TPA: molybdate ABC transporter permease subunit [Tepidisphaeraceae bacterium]|jgi:molybdate transport system permease protein